MFLRSKHACRDGIALIVAATALGTSGQARRLPSYGSISTARIPPNGWENPTIVDPGGWTTINVTNDGRLSAAQRLSPNDSTQDASAKIAAIISSTSGLGSRKLYFPAGAYYLKTHLVITTSNIWIYGDGPSTRLVQQQTSAPGHIAFVGNSTSGAAPVYGDLAGTNLLTSAPVSGANTVTLQGSTSIQVGDIVDVFQDTTPEFAADFWGKEAWGQLAKVTAVDTVNRRLTLDSKLALSYDINKRPRVRRIMPIRNIFLKDLRIERSVDNNEIDGVRLQFCENCFVAGVQSFKASDRNHINIRWSYRVVVAQSSFDNAWTTVGGGFAYGIGVGPQSAKVKVADNYFRNLRHHVLLQAGASHNVVAYNSLEPTYYSTDVALHGNWAHHNLFEGNQFATARHDGDHGVNGPLNTFYRNRANSIELGYNPTDRNNVIGNVIGAFSVANGSTDNYVEGNRIAGVDQWNTLSPSSTLPPSLFMTNQPAFLSGKPWPLYGPGVSGYGTSNTTPAADRSP